MNAEDPHSLWQALLKPPTNELQDMGRATLIYVYTASMSDRPSALQSSAAVTWMYVDKTDSTWKISSANPDLLTVRLCIAEPAGTAYM